MGSLLPRFFFFLGLILEGGDSPYSDSTYDASVHLSVAVYFSRRHQIHISDGSANMSIQERPISKRSDLVSREKKLTSQVRSLAAILGYLCIREMNRGALFHFSNGQLLTRQEFVEALRRNKQI